KNNKIICSNSLQLYQPIIKINGKRIKPSTQSTINSNTNRSNGTNHGINKISHRRISFTNNYPSNSIWRVKTIQKEKGSSRVEHSYYKRFSTNINRYTSGTNPILSNNDITRKLRSIFKTILKIPKKVIIPFTTISSTFLFANFTQAANLKDVIFQRKGILTTDFS